MEHEFYQVSLKAIIRRPDGKVLCLKGKKGGAFEGYHDLPGGRISKKEFRVSFMEILQRELQEEIGDLSVDISSIPCGVGRHLSKDGFPVIYIFFPATCTATNASVPISHEHEGYAWLELTEGSAENFFISGILEGVQQYLHQLARPSNSLSDQGVDQRKF
jgi:8-oxo-dGTP pyrophosphatase MutT (NUDIX family)